MAETPAGKMKERLRNLGDSAKKKSLTMLNKRSPSVAEKIGQEGKVIAFTPEELSRPAIVKQQREPGVYEKFCCVDALHYLSNRMTYMYDKSSETHTYRASNICLYVVGRTLICSRLTILPGPA